LAITKYEISEDTLKAEGHNVVDSYKGLPIEDIRADLIAKRSQMINIYMNLSNDFNKASAIRASNVFLGKEVYLVGKRRYDRRGAVGTQNFETIFHADTFEEVFAKLKADGYTFFAVDNILEYEPKNLWDVEFPEKSVFVYGEEKLGLSAEVIEMCDDMIYIASQGSVRSLNVSAASSVIMAEYSRQHRM